MRRIDFDKLEVIDQIEYINKELNKNNTLTSICKSIGIGRSTIRDRFKKIGYEYNKITNQYESIVEIVESKSVENVEIEPITQRSSKKVVRADNEILTNIINNYEDNLSKLNELYSWYELQINNNVVDTKKLIISDFDDKIVVRSYKLYESIQKDFTAFCKRNNKYKVQDILSQALKEFLDKYK